MVPAVRRMRKESVVSSPPPTHPCLREWSLAGSVMWALARNWDLRMVRRWSALGLEVPAMWAMRRKQSRNNALEVLGPRVAIKKKK